MISPLLFDKRLHTQSLQRGELSAEELNQRLAQLKDLSKEQVSALSELKNKQREAQEAQHEAHQGEGEA